MRRKLLPILSIACLVLAGVLMLSYVLMVHVRLAMPVRGTVADVNVQHGVAFVLSSSRSETSVPLSLEIRLLKINDDRGFTLRNQFHFEWDDAPIDASSGAVFHAGVFPAWCIILPLVVPPIVWLWRRRRRENRASVPGFPVDQTSELAATGTAT